MHVVFSQCETMYQKIVVLPIQALYMNAPSVSGIGGWGGFSEAQVCARLTGQSEVFWIDHSSECSNFVSARLNSIVITANRILYFYLLFHFIHWFARRVFQSVGQGLYLCSDVLRATPFPVETRPPSIYYVFNGTTGGPLTIN